jgi:hypothetical protein
MPSVYTYSFETKWKWAGSLWSTVVLVPLDPATMTHWVLLR